jgi:hypothetical protein
MRALEAKMNAKKFRLLTSASHWVWGLLLLVSAVFAVACHSSDNPAPVVLAAPSGLTYTTTTAVYTKGTAITANNPSSTGGAVASYAVSPALPAGLSLSATSGGISGTPTAVAAQATYTVTATNATGSTTVTLTITVKDVAPGSLTYSTASPTFSVGTPITALTPTSSGGAVVSYSVAPALPAGLSLNASTGAISGTPTAPSGTA